MKTDILIDADTLMYRVGFAKPPPDTPEHACARLDKSLEGIKAMVSYKIALSSMSDTGDTILFITSNFGKGRYRDQFNNESEYKANRGKGASPVFMEEMREHLLKNYATCDAPSHLYEADDQLSWQGWYRYHTPSVREYIICGVDKDLNQIPGQHYDYGNGSHYFVSPMEANRFFFQQLLTGDIADGIPGIKGVGPVRAKNALRDGGNPDEWWDIVLDMYTKHYKELSEDQIADMLYERGNKLWIQRYEGQTWYPPIPEIIPFTGGVPLGF